jgi:hypothetical protein
VTVVDLRVAHSRQNAKLTLTEAAIIDRCGLYICFGLLPRRLSDLGVPEVAQRRRGEHKVARVTLRRCGSSQVTQVAQRRERDFEVAGVPLVLLSSPKVTEVTLRRCDGLEWPQSEPKVQSDHIGGST